MPEPGRKRNLTRYTDFVPLPPSIDDKYELLSKLSEGGMGAVYKVRHRLLDEVRVIKVILPHAGPASELRDRFLREARAASRLGHPNVARILDFLVDEQGNQLLVQEHIDGLTLKEVLALSGPPPLGLALEIARQALDALGTLHRRGFVHRDIAPDNLMLTRGTGGAPLVKLIDLGIAKAMVAESGRDLDASLTQTGIFLGKPRYASPEQFAGEPVDARSDLYSFGMVLYELLTGRYPFLGRTVHELLAAHLGAEPLAFAESDPGERIPPALRDIVLRLLAKRPDERFQTAEDLAAALAPLAVPWPAEALDEILAQRPTEPARPAVAFSAPVAAVATRRTVQPDSPLPAVAVAGLEPAPSFLPSPGSRSRLRLAPAAVALGIAVLLALVLWAGRASFPGRPATQGSPTLQQPTPTPVPSAPTPAAIQPPGASTSAALPPGYSPGQPLGRPEPVYPEQAAGTGIAVRVTVDLEIDDRGRVVKAVAPFVDAEKPIPWELYGSFKKAALKAARSLRFQPATRDNKPIRDQVRLVIEVRPP